MIVAGEASGDKHGASLAQALKRLHPDVKFELFGSGGEEMRAAGVETLVDARDVGIIGVLEIARAIRRLYGAYRTLLSAARPSAPGASVNATFKITAGSAPFNGDLVATARWSSANGAKVSETATEKVRNGGPVSINEFRVNGGSANNTTNSFIELYNSGGPGAAIRGHPDTAPPRAGRAGGGMLRRRPHRYRRRSPPLGTRRRQSP